MNSPLKKNFFETESYFEEATETPLSASLIRMQHSLRTIEPVIWYAHSVAWWSVTGKLFAAKASYLNLLKQFCFVALKTDRRGHRMAHIFKRQWH